MNVELRIRYSEQETGSATAWHIPSRHAEEWLADLGRCGLADIDTQLFIVQEGLLAISPPAKSHARLPRGLAFQLIAGCLFIPANASIYPPLTDQEVRDLCASNKYLFHPVAGLIRLHDDFSLRIWDLLEAPTELANTWNAAQPGRAALPNLNAIVAAQPPTLEDLFGGAEKEIGSEPIVDLPPTPDEPTDKPTEKSARFLKQALAKGLAGAMKLVPHTGTERTWLNRIEDWANRHLQGINSELEQIRNKELHRLLSMLESDPEMGLRHAISMSGFAHRGIAPPSSQLGSRPLNFNPSRLGGGAADFWNIPPDLRETLQRRYRELADRETRLGRHRRAAYIYAELLGDLHSAAQVLKQGGHFREAALLYEEHLKNPLEAAKCLADGGLLEEAITRFTKLERWMEVANLQERLGNIEAAHAALRRVVREHIAKGDLLAAAKLLEHRMQAPDEALQILLGAWPSSAQAGGCAIEALRIFGRLGRHESAAEFVEHLGTNPLPRMIDPAMNALFEAARNFPHERVRHRAADLSRLLMARELGSPTLTSFAARQYTDLLVRLAPQDQLLGRDANRFIARLRATEIQRQRITPPPLPATKTKKPEIIRRIELPRQILWMRLRAESAWFFAAGRSEKHLTVARSNQDGELQTCSWNVGAEASARELIFEPTRDAGTCIAVAVVPSAMPLPIKHFPKTDLFETDCAAGTPSWLTPESMLVAFGNETIWTLHLSGQSFVLSCHDKRRKLLRTIDLPEGIFKDPDHSEGLRFSLACIGDSAVAAFGKRLVIMSDSKTVNILNLPGQARGLVTTRPHTLPGVAVMMEFGAALYWLQTNELLELDRDIPSPTGTFVAGGQFVLASGSQMIFARVDARGVHAVRRVETPGQNSLALCPGGNAGEFAVLTTAPEILICRVPEP